jgi:acetylglutamate/LysW-gamma-L-alpha-aminoadipate kinase
MLIVVKIGGDLVKSELPQNLLKNIVTNHKEHKIVIVHGGADIVSEISTSLGHPPFFITSPQGFKSRYTDKEESIIFTMVMTGNINKKIVASLESQGISTIGLSGIDCHLMKASRKKQLIIMSESGKRKLIDGGYTGKILEINSDFLNIFLERKILPVISPVALGEEYELLNVDGDRAASSIASALKADRLILLTDKQGILLDGNYVAKLDLFEAGEIQKKVGPGMITKVYAALEAVNNNVSECIITSGFTETPITDALLHKKCTLITK